MTEKELTKAHIGNFLEFLLFKDVILINDLLQFEAYINEFMELKDYWAVVKQMNEFEGAE